MLIFRDYQTVVFGEYCHERRDTGRSSVGECNIRGGAGGVSAVVFLENARGVMR